MEEPIQHLARVLSCSTACAFGTHGVLFAQGYYPLWLSLLLGKLFCVRRAIVGLFGIHVCRGNSWRTPLQPDTVLFSNYVLSCRRVVCQFVCGGNVGVA